MKSPGSRFEALDAAVECLAHGVGDAMRQVVEEALKMGLEGLGRPDNKRQATANGTCMPALESKRHAQRPVNWVAAGGRRSERRGTYGNQSDDLERWRAQARCGARRAAGGAGAGV